MFRVTRELHSTIVLRGDHKEYDRGIDSIAPSTVRYKKTRLEGNVQSACAYIQKGLFVLNKQP